MANNDMGLFKKSKKVKENRFIRIFFTVLFSFYSFMLLMPFVWILLNSFKNGALEYITDNTWKLPEHFMWSNYSNIFKLAEIDENLNMFNMFLYSIIFCIMNPTIGAISTTLAAYVMAKYKFKGQKFIYWLFMVPMLISITGTQSSLMMLWDKMGWFEMPFVGIAIMSTCGTGMNFLLVYGIFKSVSNTYMEAARIDGAGELRIFGEIMLPHAMGIIGTIWVLGFIGTWNDYGTPKLYLEDRGYYTIALGIQKIQEQVTKVNDPTQFNVSLAGNYPLFYSAIILSLIPVITIFLIFQKQIMKLSLGGGIK